ncbi:hypothetical protein PVT67_01350 [Gallaecimonas kandeliae]|uniref:L,D-transpeptidase family protein n=1 Tax=Gallaecimonas kandeliae TaxID=3029055 RepID=UPI0026493FDC|nr:hypothetical protein [Gallaecimonas kandeliae]WKE65935.1 hypothetical protein PVT67_01350 [Gallaecimonas kandeliae]
MPRILILALLLAWPAFAQEHRQLVLVTSPGWQATQGLLQSFEKVGGQWRPGPVSTAVVLGRSGMAWGLGLYPTHALAPAKVEGDGKTPAGVFALGSAFGYGKTLDSALPYLATTASSYCMDVPASPYYNQLVDAAELGPQAVAGSSEPLRLDLRTPGDLRYQLALQVLHNPANIPGAGSCIFLHRWGGPKVTTSGCTAMAPGPLAALLRWLDPAKMPLLVVVPKAQYPRLAREWGLPPG